MQAKKNVCLIYGNIKPYPDGGADYASALASSLCDKCDVSVVTSTSMKKYLFEDEKYKVYPIVNNWGLSGLVDFSSQFYKHFMDNLYEHIIIIYPCVSVDGNKNYLLPALLPFIKRSAKLTTIWFTPIPPRPNLFELMAAATLYFFSNKIVSMDVHVSHLINKWFPLKKIKFSGCGSTMSVNKRYDLNNVLAAKLKLGLDQQSKYIAYFGYWSNSKGTDIAIRTLYAIKQRKGLYDYKLILVGGRSKDRYRIYDSSIVDMVKELGLVNDVLYTGPISDDAVEQYLLASDVFLMPYRRIFTSRSTLANAIALGLPVVATVKQGQNPFLKNRTNAMVVYDFDESKVADCIVELVSDHKLVQKLTENIINLNEIYSWESLSNVVLNE